MLIQIPNHTIFLKMIPLKTPPTQLKCLFMLLVDDPHNNSDNLSSAEPSTDTKPPVNPV